jgi:hypothetical protein
MPLHPLNLGACLGKHKLCRRRNLWTNAIAWNQYCCMGHEPVHSTGLESLPL